MKDEMSRARFEEEHKGVKVVVNGEMEILDLKILPNTPETSVKDAINRAMHKAKAEAAKIMSKMTGGLSLPGM